VSEAGRRIVHGSERDAGVRSLEDDDDARAVGEEVLAIARAVRPFEPLAIANCIAAVFAIRCLRSARP